MSGGLPKWKRTFAPIGCKFGTWTAAMVFMWLFGMTAYTIVFYKTYSELRAMGEYTKRLVL